MLNKVISFLHILLGIFMSIYAFIIPKNFTYDLCYILFLLFMLFSWILYDNQCFITYYYNKINERNIKERNIKDKNKQNVSDVHELIDETSFFGKFCFCLTTILMITSVYITAIRSKIMSPFITTIFIFLRYLYAFYNSAVGYNFESCCLHLFNKETYNKISNLYKNTGFHYTIKPYFNTTILILNIVILVYIFYKNKSRIFK